MKKKLFAALVILGGSNVFAQDLTSSKGESILPEVNDWAIGFDASSVFSAIGGMFSNNSSNNTNLNWLSQEQTFVGKKFIDKKQAYRLILKFGFLYETEKNIVTKDNGAVVNFPTPQEKVEDKRSKSGSSIMIGFGKEFRKGNTRLQGYYGADALIWLSTAKTSYSYGNEFNTTNNVLPTSTNFDSVTTIGYYSSPVSIRLLENKSGLGFGIGVRGFVGAEYFFLPKISLGLEYGWGLGFQTKGAGKAIEQKIDGSPAVVGSVYSPTPSSSKFGFDNDMNNGKILGFRGNNNGNASLKLTFVF